MNFTKFVPEVTGLELNVLVTLSKVHTKLEELQL